MESLAERLSYKRAGGSKDHHREHRLSKASIGQPIKIEGNGKVSENADSTESSAGPSMVMKCIIVQKDDKGYGLTVSGDNPVYIQSVKHDGAAAKAGVSQGDRIVKVNGAKVTDLNHVEVVKLIKADSYVALTLLGAPPSALPGAPSNLDATNLSNPQNPTEVSSATKLRKQHTFHDEKVVTIKKMLEQETAEVERIKEEYARNPEPKILKELGAAKKMKQDLEKQLWKVESMRDSCPETSSAHCSEVDDSSRSAEPNEDQRASADVACSDGARSDARTSTTDSARQRRSQVVNESALEGKVGPIPNSAAPGANEKSLPLDLFEECEPTNPFSEQFILAEERNPSHQRKSKIINFEDDDIVGDNETFQDHGPFSDLEKLRQRPAHLAVFFNYVIASHEPANFLLTVVVDSYRQLSSAKDMIKHGEAIYKTYLASNAPYKVAVDEGISRSIQSVLSSKNPSEEALRGVFDPAVQVANNEIREQLSLYRTKREQGLASLFGDEKLQIAIQSEQQSDIRVVDEIITPTLTELLQTSASEDIEQTRLNIKQEALQTFLNQYGTKRPKSKASSRLYSMLRPSRPQPLNKSSRVSGSMDSIIDEQNNRKSGIGGIFGVKGRKRNDANATAEKQKSFVHERASSGSKRDKSVRHTIWENPGSGQTASLKPGKVSTSSSSGQLSSLLPQEETGSFLYRKRSSESSGSPSPGGREGAVVRSKTMSFDGAYVAETHTVSIQPPPQIHEPVLNDPPDNHGNPFLTNQDNESVGDSGDNLSIDKSASSDQLDQINRHLPLSSSDSTISLVSEERKFIEQLPSFADDPEINIDAYEQNRSERIPKNVVRDLDRKEVKRQQIINEFIYTEKHHVRDLKILEKLFYEPFATENLLSPDELNQAFPNLKDLLSLHRELNQALHEKKDHDGHVVKEIGDILLARFDGEGGNVFKEECAAYCGNQSAVLSLIKEKIKKDQKFSQFVQAAQKHPVCRKLHLKDFIPMEFQRLTKYPLLLENIMKNTKKKQEAENDKVRKACKRCREILAFVNQAVKEAEDKQKILEIQQNLDRDPILKLKQPSKVTKEFRQIDLTERPSLLQGPLMFRIGQTDKRKEIPLHCILYDDVMVLLQKQEERYILKCYGNQSDKASGTSHDPFLPMDRLIIRNVATDKRAFFAMSTSDVGPKMYELVASSTSVKKQWMEVITETTKKKESLLSPTHRRKGFVVPGSSRSEGEGQFDDELGKQIPAGDFVGRGEDNHQATMPVSPDSDPFVTSSSSSLRSPYIDPNIHIGKIHAIHEAIKEALLAKCKLLADMSGLDEQELEEILDISAADSEPEPGILIKHAVLCVDKLTGLLNDCAMPENIILLPRAESQPDPSGSNRLSVGENETGYHSDSGPISPSAKWAVRVPHPSQSLPPDITPSPHEESSATLYSIPDLPMSESDPTLSESDANSVKLHADENSATREQCPDTAEPFSPNQHNTPSAYQEPSNTPLMVPPNLTLPPCDSTGEPSKSRPPSGVELGARAGFVPINKMLDIVTCLQTQLTRLMHLLGESESDRQRLNKENQELRDELLKIENEEPPTYNDAVHSDGNAGDVLK